MSFREFLLQVYLWANTQAATIALSALVVPLLGGLSVALVKWWRLEAARLMANLQLYASMMFFLTGTLMVMLLYQVFAFSPLDVNVLLLAAPLAALAATFGSIRLLFPVSELVSVQTAFDLLWFVGGCAALAWFFSKFEGWGLIFFGGFTSLVLFLVVSVFLLRRVSRRAFGLTPRRTTAR